jgi:bifunctional non-homologous end joining protein LigD
MARSLPRFEPMLASTGPIPHDRAGSAIEPKFDGFRAILFLNDPAGAPLRVQSRSGRAVTDLVPELSPLAATVGTDAVLDGELIVTDDAGRPDFYALSRRMLASPTSPLSHLRHRSTVTFVAFDLLWLDGAPLVSRPYAERRARLEDLVLAGPAWMTTPSYRGVPAEEVLAACAALGIEGILEKGASSVYEGRRSRWWCKRKTAAWQAEHAPRRRPGPRSARGRPPLPSGLPQG